MSTAQMNLLISTNRIGTEASANPVRGEGHQVANCSDRKNSKWTTDPIAHLVSSASQSYLECQ
ncbi:hypothetical protein [Escherichia coli]|uniref:hypothetical protein n=1 Tax=Escherichia coli TaxID=562 RepID=UPI0024A82D0F|nr:hypothetical protein [Escherichia coli]WHI39102.1 hypothetical protein QDW51_26495 [Escherichia coli]